MNKSIFTLVILFTIKFNLNAQTVEPSSTINKNNLQIELETLYSIQKEGPETLKSWSLPSALFRYGLFNGLELQLNTPIVKEKLWEEDHLIHSLHKFDDIQAGFAVNLWKNKNIIPEAALMIRVILPTHSTFKFDKIGQVISLNLSNALNNKLSFNNNIGYVVETDNSKSGYYITNLSYNATNKIHFFIESFGEFDNKKFTSHNINTGVGYNFSNNYTFDLAVANGINHNMFYVGGIFTWVINTKN